MAELSLEQRAMEAVEKAARHRIDDPRTQIIAEQLAEIAALREEVRLDEMLLAERQRVLAAIPECSVHGHCVPHAIEWIARAVAALSAPAQSPWRPIEEAPLDDKPVWATGLNGGKGPGRHYVTATWSVYEWLDDAGDTLSYLTHYMELPAPPAQQSDGETK